MNTVSMNLNMISNEMSQSWSFRDRVATSFAQTGAKLASLDLAASRASGRAYPPTQSVNQSLTLALASLAASASAAMALWSCTGRRTSFLKER